MAGFTLKTIALSTALVSLGAVAAIAGGNKMVGGAEMFPEKNIVENAVNSKDHTTLVAAVKAAGLVDTLSGAGPFTVFAPTNAAFDALPAGTVDMLLKPENKDQLTKILTCHVDRRRSDVGCHQQDGYGRRRHAQGEDGRWLRVHGEVGRRQDHDRG